MLSIRHSGRLVFPGRAIRVTSALAVVAGMALSAVSASAQRVGRGHDEPQDSYEGRLYNITDEPFTFRLQRRFGPMWTQYYTVAPNEFFTVPVPSSDEESELMGVLGNREGYVVIEYPGLGGLLTWRLPARNPQSREFEPTWFYVKDSSGLGWLVQAGSVEAAQQRQRELQAQKPRTPAEIEVLRKNLIANWTLILPRDRDSVGWGIEGVR